MQVEVRCWVIVDENKMVEAHRPGGRSLRKADVIAVARNSCAVCYEASLSPAIAASAGVGEMLAKEAMGGLAAPSTVAAIFTDVLSHSGGRSRNTSGAVRQVRVAPCRLPVAFSGRGRGDAPRARVINAAFAG